MRLRTAVIVMSLSLACFLSRVSFADTLTMQSGYPADDQFVGAEYVYPYYFTFTGPGGTDSLVAMSCMNYNRDIGLGESWDVTPSSCRPSIPVPPSTTVPSTAPRFSRTHISLTSTPRPRETPR